MAQPDGRVPPKKIRSKRKKARHSVREIAPRGRETLIKPIRGRRRLRPWQAPDDVLEDRAADVPGSILERVVYKELLNQLGSGGFIFKKGALGARLFRGGIEIDFLVTARHPNIALEVLGAFWHGPNVAHKDAARALVVRGLLGDDGLNLQYEEITEAEIRISEAFLETKIRNILGNAVDIGRPV